MRLQDTPIERTGNMENLIDAEMAREDLGRMTYMSLEVRKKLFVCLMEAIIIFVVCRFVYFKLKLYSFFYC